ncbi:FAD-dependent oxidoreductase [Nocardioides dubius]|uniref:FAD/NAD(P)-binding oxidoreductase n=1 Tax=Nocardioides dubius TaxID=317019 RepID=A0ABP4EGG8_9ACTN
MSTHVVIVGAGLAGLRTAERLRRGGYDGVLTLVGTESHPPYDRPPLSKSLLAAKETPDLPALRGSDRLAELDLDLRAGVTATRLDPEAHLVTLDDGSELAYDHLVIATGLAARAFPQWQGVEGVHVLRTFDDCLDLRASAARARHATVIGAGVLGSEIAATLRGRGTAVDLVDTLPQPLYRVAGDEVGAFIATLHRSHGVGLHLGRTVEELSTDDGRVREVRLDDGTRLRTDLVVVAVGASPVIDWLESSGLQLDAGVVVNDRGATSAPDVWAVGDVAAVPDPRGDGTVRIEHWTAAGDLAATVAANVLAALGTGEPRAHAEIPYMWSDQYDVKVQCLGLPRASDERVLLTGSLESGAFLLAFVDGGHVKAVVGAGMPAALMRCRAAVTGSWPVAELQDTAPWERRKATA